MAAGRSTNGGQITISQWVEVATSGLNLSKNAPVSLGVLYIFQLPAMMGRRIRVVGSREWVVGKAKSARAKNWLLVKLLCGNCRRPSGRCRIAWIAGPGSIPPAFSAGRQAAEHTRGYGRWKASSDRTHG